MYRYRYVASPELEARTFGEYDSYRQSYPEPDHPLVKNEMDPEFRKDLESFRSNVDSIKQGLPPKYVEVSNWMVEMFSPSHLLM
jgi:hypothetical protein